MEKLYYITMYSLLEGQFWNVSSIKVYFLFEVYGWICFKIHGSEGIYNVEKLSDYAVLRN